MVVVAVFVILGIVALCMRKKNSDFITNETFANVPKMRIAVVMWYNDKIKKFADLNYRINKLYCDKYNIDIYKSDEVTYKNRKPTWEKIPLILKYLTQYDYVMWVDADAFFLKDARDIRQLIRKTPDKHFIFSEDISTNISPNISPNINAGVYIVKNTEYSIQCLNYWGYDNDLYKEVSRRNKAGITVWNDQAGLIIMYDEQNKFNIRQHSVVYDYGVIQNFDVNCIKESYEKEKPYILHMAGALGTYTGEKNEKRYTISKKYYDNYY